MEDEQKKARGAQLNARMRKLHRDVGGLVVAMSVMFAMSGMIMVFRDVEFLQRETRVEKTIAAGLGPDEVKEALRLRQFRLRGAPAGAIIEFEGGTYDPATGKASYVEKGYPAPVKQVTTLHKATSGRPFFFVTLAYALALLTLVVTSFWMYKPGTPQFRRFTLMVGAGIVGAGVVLLLV